VIHRIELPVRVIVGSGALSELPGIIRAFTSSGRPVVVISGPNVWRLYGAKLREQLESMNGLEYSVFEAKEATVGYAEALAEKVSELKPALVLGFGGGKSVDLAKYVAFRSGARMVSVPTSPSHDGIASPFASLKGTERPYSVKTVTPIAIVADLDIIASAPLRLIRAGAGDLIAKLTAIRDWKLAHKLKGEYYGEYAAKLALLSAKHVIEYAGQIGKGSKEGVRVLVEGLVSSGVAMCIAGSTRPASGSEHLFAHALEVLSPGIALHGEEVALGTIMMMYLHGGNWRKVKLTLKKLGLPTKAKELGIDETLIVKALTIAHKIRPERYTILGDTGLTWEAAERLAKVTGVID
jgi:glycerol-1-phosphate dehydrogenase [NAD(P)+]